MKNGFKLFESLSYEAKTIFNIIQKKGPQTKNDLSLMTNMKLTTLNRAMEPLESSGLIIQSRIGESTGGRKPVLYDVNADKFYIFGIDISRMYAQVIVVNLKLEVKYKQQFTMDISTTPDKTVKLISNIISNAFKQLDINFEKLLGFGVGTVGPLDTQKGIMLNPANFEAPGWVNVPIKAMLEKELTDCVFVDNGANAAVLGEMLFGKGQGFKDVAYLNCGVGIRTGAVSSGNIVRTLNDAEDAFGHMVIDIDGEPCSCGNFGCIECYSSIYSINGKFISELKKGRTSKLTKPINEISFIDICNAANENDDLAKEVITGAAAVLGTGLANFINLINPGLVILSGPLINCSELFYKVCTDIAAKKCCRYKESNIVFSRGGYFEDSAISVGAAVMLMEKCIAK